VENRANESGNGRGYKERGKRGLFIGASYLEKKVVYYSQMGAAQVKAHRTISRPKA
jgi:hypothetical protein